MLDICKSFFDFLNESDIRYCHWKSNINLERSLNGKTDLDLLVHSADTAEFVNALNEFNIKKILSPPEKQFPGMEDYLGFDHETGSLIHLHVHYRLILGQKYIKNHHLPIENLIFANLTTKYNVCIPCPEVELLLLVIRAHMKVDVVSLVKHGVKDILGHHYTAFPADIEKEFKSLIENSDIDKFVDILEQSNLPISINRFIYFFKKFTNGKLTFLDIVNFQWQILSALKEYRRRKGVSVYFKYAQHFLKNSFLLYRIIDPGKKRIEGEGKIFSLVGADGSGKSTLVSALEKWLSWKLDVSEYYYGIPKTIQVKLFSFLIRGLNKCRLNRLASQVETFLWLYIAKRRFKICLNSKRDILEGKMVITDRFPLKEFHDMPEPMDGPRISKCIPDSSSWIVREEEAFYDRIVYPDRVFVLQVALEELRARKTDLDLETHKCKAAAVNSLKDGSAVVLINANMPYHEVEIELKRKIWAMV